MKVETSKKIGDQMKLKSPEGLMMFDYVTRKPKEWTKDFRIFTEEKELTWQFFFFRPLLGT